MSDAVVENGADTDNSLRNLKLTVSYDGSRYHGWQIQPDKQTVQAEIERAIFQITGAQTRVAGAGRTDAGVHAIGQVCNFSTRSNIPVERFRPALQSQLPAEIAIRRVEEVSSHFHAGYAARWKQYRYVILNTEVHSPLLRNFVTWINSALNLEAMNEAAAALIGTHDFRSFESQFPNKATSIRTVYWCRLRRAELWEVWQPGFAPDLSSGARQDCLFLDIAADGFLYNMVRAIMGTLLKIGLERWPVSAARAVLEAQDRKLAGPTAPPQGLYLMHVEYDQPFPAAE